MGTFAGQGYSRVTSQYVQRTTQVNFCRRQKANVGTSKILRVSVLRLEWGWLAVSTALYVSGGLSLQPICLCGSVCPWPDCSQTNVSTTRVFTGRCVDRQCVHRPMCSRPDKYVYGSMCPRLTVFQIRYVCDPNCLLPDVFFVLLICPRPDMSLARYAYNFMFLWLDLFMTRVSTARCVHGLMWLRSVSTARCVYYLSCRWTKASTVQYGPMWPIPKLSTDSLTDWPCVLIAVAHHEDDLKSWERESLENWQANGLDDEMDSTSRWWAETSDLSFIRLFRLGHTLVSMCHFPSVSSLWDPADRWTIKCCARRRFEYSFHISFIMTSKRRKLDINKLCFPDVLLHSTKSQNHWNNHGSSDHIKEEGGGGGGGGRRGASERF